MKIINTSYSLIANIIKPDINAPEYIASIYNVIEKYDNNEYIVFNTFSRALIIIDEVEYKKIFNSKQHSYSDVFIKKLVDMFFLVSSDLDEEKRYLQTFNIIKLLNLKNNKIKKFKIYTTTHCNARCFYCFEEGIAKENMTAETTEAVIEYIYKNMDDKIVLYWFGGEPLCNTKVIDRICSRLKSDNVNFESNIITNGYLFNEDKIKYAIQNWNLTFAQITLDGLREEHNKRKAYINPFFDPFDKTIQNIHILNDNNVKTIVRLNFDNNNLENIKQLILFLEKEFLGSKNITVSPVLLVDDCFNHRTDTVNTDKSKLNNELLNLQELLFNKNMLYYSSVYNKLKTNRCMADNPNSVIIGTDGRLFTCQSCDEDMCYGNIYEGITNRVLIDAWHNPKNIRKKCLKCKFLPECTPFNKCPIEHEFCITSNDYRIRKKMHASVEKHI